MNRIFEAVAKGFPGRIGNTYFVSDTTGLFWNALNLQYPPNKDGNTVVFSSVTDALAACTAAQGEVIVLAPDFTTVLTATEENNAATKGVLVVWARDELDGKFRADKATAALAQGVSSLFTVTGKVKLLNLIGEVTTAVSDTAVSVTLSSVPTVGASAGIAGIISVRNNAAGVLWNITGTIANDIATSVASGISQVTGLIIPPGAIKLQTSATPAAGSVKWHVLWEPVDQGARVIPA